jgi:hypothetical protein
MDQEIDYASAAGLDYWAFVTYAEGNAMSIGLDLYLSSAKKSKIKFCLILGASALGPTSDWPNKIDRFVEYFKDPSYQKIGNRPLVYLFNPRQYYVINPFGSWDKMKEAFDDLRKEAQKAGLASPYYVVQVFGPNDGKLFLEKLGFHAVSAYATNGGGVEAPYSSLVSYTENWWNKVRNTGMKVIPLVMAGWDRRPRVLYPMPWETNQQPGEGIEKYYETATPEELAQHLKNAVEWNKSYPNTAETNAILIYAWNETDEGGWLLPTLSDGSARLDAIKQVLAGYD